MIDSTLNLVTIFKLDERLSSLIVKVQTQMIHNNKFWSDFPIYLNQTNLLTKEEKEQLKK